MTGEAERSSAPKEHDAQPLLDGLPSSHLPQQLHNGLSEENRQTTGCDPHSCWQMAMLSVSWS